MAVRYVSPVLLEPVICLLFSIISYEFETTLFPFSILLKNNFQSKVKLWFSHKYKMKILFNSLSNKRTQQMLLFIQRRIQRTDTLIDQEYWNKFANRCKTSESAVSTELLLDKIYLHWQVYRRELLWTAIVIY